LTLDLDHIEATEDRSFTSALVARLGEPGVSRALLALDDPRAREPLLRLLEDHTAAPAAREAAGEILLESGEGVHRHEALRWWATGDELLREQALFAMEAEDASIVVPVAEHPGHPLHRHAIEAMKYGFEAPRFQAVKIAALDHSDPKVREAAAEVLLWDEPVAAEEALLRCAGDADPAVACAAMDTLRYYPTRRCVARLEGLRTSPYESVREAVDVALEDLRETMRPPEPPNPVEARPSARPTAPRIVYRADALLAELSDPDGPWKERKARFSRVEWEAFTAAERTRLTSFLLAHADPWVRSEASVGLAAWQDHGALLALLHDRCFGVMKHAAYALGLTTPNPDAAAALRAHLDAPRVTSTHARETLQAWVTHAGSAAVPDLVALARHDERETVQVAAIYALTHLGARDELESLFPLLAAPPRVTWSVHTTLIDACTELGLAPPGLDTLRAVDNYG
jgi:HEAT repeat protein